MSIWLCRRYELSEDIHRTSLMLAEMYLTTGGEVSEALSYAQLSLDTAVKVKSKELQKDALLTKAKVGASLLFYIYYFVLV